MSRVADQPGVIARAAGWLRPGGLFVATVGHTAWTGTESDWLGGGAEMWCGATPRQQPIEPGSSRPDSASTTSAFVPEGTGGHTLFVATRRR